MKKTPNVSLWWHNRRFLIVIAIASLMAILALITLTITKNERHLTTGTPVLLALAPVDPRGFMQGDYMALSYALERDVLTALEHNPNSFPNNDGFVIVKIDEHNVGHFVRLVSNHSDISRNKLAANELAVFYRVRNNSVYIATNAFFFQEGHAESFEAAKYGLFRVNENGKPLLTNMVNDKFEIIKGSANPVDSTEE